MLQRILVPTDLSPHSLDAYRKAIDLARLSGGTIDLLHVVPPRSQVRKLLDASFAGTIEGADPELQREAEAQLIAFASSVPHRDVIVKSRVDPGDPAGTIVQEASEDFDLIVMGTRGRIGLSAALGSVALKVVSTANCPVMLVRG